MEQNPALGPFTKQTFDKEFWKKILDSLLQLQYDFQKPTFLPAYKYLRQLIQEINSSPHYDKYFGLPSIKDYFLNQFLPSATISLIDCKSAVDNKLIEFIDECLCQLVDLCLKTLKQGLFGPARILDLILKPTRPYYQSIRPSSSCKKSSEEHDSNDLNKNRVLFTEIRPENDPPAFLWDLINKFGAGGGFELIYDTIYDTPILPQNVSILCSMMANICPILNKGFVQEYVPKLEEAVMANWFSHPYVNLAYQVAEAMTEAFKILLARIYPSLERANMIARFKLKLCARYFEFSSSESLTQGLGSLTNIIKENDNLDFSEILQEFIKENNIFREIYVPQGYPGLIRQSVQFMQHLLKKNWIASEDLDVLWDCIINGKPDVVSELYNLLHCCGQSLQDSHADYLLSKIIELPIQEITEKKMEVAIVVAKIKIMTSYPSKKFWELFWKVASLNQKSQAAMPLYYADAFQRFYRYIVIRHLEYKDEILSALNELLECIDRKESVLIALGRIKMMITHFNETSVSKTGFTRSVCINHLCKKYNMIKRILNELKSFKGELLKKIPNKNDLADKALNDELLQIYERLDCIKYILTNYKGSEEILDDEMLYDIWNMTIANAITEGERKYGFNFLRELVDLIYNSPLISPDNLLRFFRRKLNYKELQDCQSLNETAFVCFNKFFIIVNLNLGNLSGLFKLSSNKHSSSSSAAKKETDTRKTEPLDHQVNVSPNQLEGIEELWKFWMEDCGFYSLAEALINIYMHPNIIPKRQEFLDRYFKRLKKELENNTQNKIRRNTLTRYFTLIADAIEEAELEGHGNLKSHSELVLGEPLNLRLHFNNTHMPHKDARKVELNLDSNASLFNLRLNIAAMFGVKWNEIDITKEKESDIIYPHSDNNKTLDNLDLYTRQTLCINKVPVTPCYPEDLLININEMNPKAKAILLEAFEQFSDQGKMSPENYAAYIGECTGYRYHIIAVVEYFKQMDNDRDGYLNQEEFLRSYLSLWQSKPDVVRNHLRGLGYRDDFKKVNRLGQINVNEKSLLRYLISINNDHFQLLYSLLEDDDAQIAEKAWSLISQLPTNVQILEEIVVLKGVKSSPDTQITPNWYVLFNPKSKYKLLYSLMGVESLIQNTFKSKKNNERENFIMDFLWPQNEELSKYWKDWPTDFLVHGGPTHLINIFIQIINSDSEKLDKIERSIICSILRIVESYLPVVAIYLPPGSNRIPSLKRILDQLVTFCDEYIKGKRILAAGKEYLKINERKSTKVQIDVSKEEQAIDIFLKANLKSFIRGIVELNFNLLKMPEKSFEADDLMVSKSSITFLRTLILYGESIENNYKK